MDQSDYEPKMLWNVIQQMTAANVLDKVKSLGFAKPLERGVRRDCNRNKCEAANRDREGRFGVEGKTRAAVLWTHFIPLQSDDYEPV